MAGLSMAGTEDVEELPPLYSDHARRSASRTEAGSSQSPASRAIFELSAVKYVVGLFADHKERDAAQAVIEGKADEGRGEHVSFVRNQHRLDNEDAFPYLFLDNAPLGSKYNDVRIYFVLAKKQGSTEMEAVVRTSLPNFYRLHGKLPLVAFSSGFCGGYRREGQKADTLGDVCLALGAMRHRSGGKITAAGLEAYVETVEPEGWADWNNLAGTPKLWSAPDQIRGLNTPQRKGKDGVETDGWQAQLKRGYFSTDEVVKNFKCAFDEVIIHNRKIVVLDMEAYNFYHACNHAFKRTRFPCILAKAITDYAEGKNEASDEDFQPYGAHLAALYLLELMGLYIDTLEH